MPLGLALFALALLGALDDWRYKRRGGKRPSMSDRLLFLCAYVLVAGILLYMGALAFGSDARVSGATMAFAVLPLFLAWELARWRIRRKYPLPALPPNDLPVTAPHSFTCSHCGRLTSQSAKFCGNCGKSLTEQ